MTSRSSPPVLMAPGAAGSSHGAYAPGAHDRRPAVDDRLVAPESHAQILDGRVILTMGANPPHAVKHTEVVHLFRGCLAEGYETAVDMLTRADETSDLAPDVSVFPTGDDPKTGGRRLEEVAFEVLDSERMSHVTEKAEKLIARGVRRVFCVRVTDRTVFEWSREADGWTTLDADSEIVDACFRVAIPVRALVDRVLADDTVARALIASRNGVITEALARSRDEGMRSGELRAKRATLRSLCGALGVALTPEDEARIDACTDVTVLESWITSVATTRSLGEVAR